MVTFTPPTQLTGVRVSAAAGQLVCWLGGQWCNGYFLAYHAADRGSSLGSGRSASLLAWWSVV